MNRRAGIGAIVVVALVLGVGRLAAADKLKLGDKAPEFSLKDLADQDVALKDFQGRVVYLDFWATWAPPCRRALPHDQELSARKEAQGDDAKLAVLTLDLREDKAKVQKHITDGKYSFRTLLDTKGAIAEAYGVRGIPTFVVINKDGTIGWMGSGYGPDTAKEIDQAVAAALAR